MLIELLGNFVASFAQNRCGRQRVIPGVSAGNIVSVMHVKGFFIRFAHLAFPFRLLEFLQSEFLPTWIKILRIGHCQTSSLTQSCQVFLPSRGLSGPNRRTKRIQMSGCPIVFMGLCLILAPLVLRLSCSSISCRFRSYGVAKLRQGTNGKNCRSPP